MRLIDADELLTDPYFQDESIPEKDMFIEAVEDSPTIDAVEVVRCKDCRYWDKTQSPTYGNQFCFYTMMFTAENHFCAKGAKMGVEVYDDENNNHDN